MPEIEIMIGGKGFMVSCQPGEEHFLRTAAQLLDNEATPLIGAMGRLPEAKMLLMAGLMLADKTAAVEDELGQARARIAELEARPATASDPVEVRVEVPVTPPGLAGALAALAERAEALAGRVEAGVPA